MNTEKRQAILSAMSTKSLCEGLRQLADGYSDHDSDIPLGEVAYLLVEEACERLHRLEDLMR